MAKIFLTGGAGFIGSHLARRFVERGDEVTVFDNLLLGRVEHIAPWLDRPGFRFVQADLLDLPAVASAMAGHDVVYHMAANSDISHGARVTRVDLDLGTVATYHVLEAMRTHGLKQIVFASTSAIYGEAHVHPTPEDYGPLLPISLYGASKLACEGLISAFCHNYGMRAWICRFGNVVGDNGTHGALFDFLQRLLADPTQLRILGDGRQAKPYLYGPDLVDGMLFIHAHSREEVNYFNLACEGATSVTYIAQAACRALGLDPSEVHFEYTGGQRGWKGDVPQVRLDPGKLGALGWRTRYDSDAAVEVAARALAPQLRARAER